MARAGEQGYAGAEHERVDLDDDVFRDDEADTYRPAIDRYIADQHAAGKTTPKAPKNAAAARTQYRAWKTFQISDHLPMWVELGVDFSDDYLASLTDPT